MVGIDEVPKTLSIPEEMRQAVADLNMVTPFSKWGLAKLWEAIEQERRKEPRKNEVRDAE